MKNRYPMPRWWRDCRDRKRHKVSIDSRRHVYEVEYLCAECARSETVKAEKGRV